MTTDCCIESSYENPPMLENESLCVSILYAAMIGTGMGSEHALTNAISEYRDMQKQLKGDENVEN